MSRRFVIALIVAVVSALTAGTMATIAAVAARAGFAMPARVWIWVAIALDALFIYAVFERRAFLLNPMLSLKPYGRYQGPDPAIVRHCRGR